MVSTHLPQGAHPSGKTDERTSEQTRQTIALEKIATAIEALSIEMHAIREALVRIGSRAGRGEE